MTPKINHHYTTIVFLNCLDITLKELFQPRLVFLKALHCWLATENCQIDTISQAIKVVFDKSLFKDTKCLVLVMEKIGSFNADKNNNTNYNSDNDSTNGDSNTNKKMNTIRNGNDKLDNNSNGNKISNLGNVSK